MVVLPWAAIVAFGIAATVAAGCEQRHAARLSVITEPYLAHFAGFDRWVRRASLGEGGFGVSSAWPEAVFARLRHDSKVAGAWVNRPDMDMPYVSYPQSKQVPGGLHWVLLRRPGFERLHAAEAVLVGESTPCLLLSHQSKDSPRVQVIVAYRLTSQ